MNKLILILLVSLSSQSWAVSWALSGSYSYLDSWLPSKYGINFIYKNEAQRTVELSYQRASYSFDVILDDFGEITDERLSMLTRSFKYAGSFNYHYGFSINRLSANLGPRQLGYDFEVFTMKTVNILWGVGNRYSINKSWFIGIDWLRIYFPIYSFENGTSSISKARDLIKNAPTFTILALELGYKF